MSKSRNEFLKIPKPLRELRGVSWPAKAVLALLRFRQRDREHVGIGARRLAENLGMAPNSVCRALAEGVDCGLLQIVNPKAPRGMRRLYDARALDTLQSDATLETLSTQGKCRKGCDTSDAKAATVECVSPCDGSDATSATRKEVTQEGADKEGRKNTADGTETASLSPAALNAENQNGNNDKNGNGAPREQRHDDGDDRLISFAFPGGASEKQRAATVNAIANAIRQGASYPLLAHAVISSKVEGDTPWERIENAGRRTAGLLSTARWTWPDFKGGTLLELLEHADRTQKVDQLAWELGGWRKQVVEWPDNGVAASDAVAPKR